MSFVLNWVLRLRSQEASREIDQVRLDAAEASRAVARQLRTAMQLSVLTFQSIGGGLNQIYALGIEAVLLQIETLVTAEAALAAGTLGLGTGFRLIASSIAVASMYNQMRLLRAGQTKAAQQIGYLTGTSRFVSYL